MVDLSPNQTLYAGLLLLVVLERGLELLLSNRNTQIALNQGGVEIGQRHYRVMVVLHSLFLLACPLEVVLFERPFQLLLGLSMGGMLLFSMSLRYWAVLSLGTRWNTRVLVVPGLPAVTKGPYRWVRHPNYVAVVIELAALPLIHGAWVTALVFSAANLVLLKVRIQVEENALAKHCSYHETMGNLPRFLPEIQ